MPNSPAIRVWYIHGNWQTPDVWNPIMDDVARLSNSAGLKIDQVAVEYWNTPAESLEEWAHDFNAQVDATRGELNIVVGYSMGGRMAMQAIVDSNDLWAAAILVSADPGTSEVRVRREQLERDRRWANKLRTSPINEVMMEWDSLPVFGGIRNTAPREVYRLNPDEMSRVMVAFSKGVQADLLDGLSALSFPVIYLSGAVDIRYNEIGHRLSAGSNCIKHVSIDGAGHRVPWEQSERFVAEVIRTINSVESVSQGGGSL